jgi:hypothetical protein
MTDEELRYRVDTALAEVGWGGHIRPPSRYAPKGTRFGITRGTVPIEYTWRALALVTLQLVGPATPVRCARHASILHRAECPRYPVGALLAGAITGCPDAKP